MYLFWKEKIALRRDGRRQIKRFNNLFDKKKGIIIEGNS